MTPASAEWQTTQSATAASGMARLPNENARMRSHLSHLALLVGHEMPGGSYFWRMLTPAGHFQYKARNCGCKHEKLRLLSQIINAFIPSFLL